jgi:hypothetical protein
LPAAPQTLPIDAGVRIEVVHAHWGAEDEVYERGEHELAKPSKKLLRLIAGAEAAGAVVVHVATAAERKLLDGHLQSQADGEAAYKKAVADGDWQHGNLTVFIVEREDRLAYSETLPDGHEEKLSPAQRERFEQHLARARGDLAAIEAPA